MRDEMMGGTALPIDEGRHGRPGRHWMASVSSYLVMIFVLISLNFFIPRAMPGDPIDALLAQGSSNFTFGKQGRLALARYYRTDRPLLDQYGHYLSRLAHGDLGRSIVSNAPVWTELSRRIPWTLLLIGSSLVLSTLLGLVAGVHAGWRRDRPMDRALLTGLLAVREFPTFLLGSLLLFVFAVKFHLVPLFGAETPFSGSFSLTHKAVDIARHLVLPLVVLTVGLTAGNYLVMRAGMVNELGADYLLLGRAKGLGERRLKYRYAARNALLPVVSLAALQLGFVVTGDVLIEQVFSYPGVGHLIFLSIGSRDYPVIQGTFLLTTISVVTVNALTNVLYRRLDPRTSP